MKNVKKLLALLLAMTMLFALCACGDDTKKDDKKDDKKDTATTTQAVNADPSAVPTTAPSQNSNQDQDNIVVAPLGAWVCDDMNMTLANDGTGTLGDETDSISITWNMVNADTLRLVNEEGEEEIVTFTLNNNVLTFVLDDNSKMVWTKKTATNDIPDVDVDVDVEITYDANLIATWYGDDGSTLDLAEGGNGTLYLGDSEEYEVAWGVADGVLCLSYEDQDMYILYEIDGDNMTLTFEDGDVSTFIR